MRATIFLHLALPGHQVVLAPAPAPPALPASLQLDKASASLIPTAAASRAGGYPVRARGVRSQNININDTIDFINLHIDILNSHMHNINT